MKKLLLLALPSLIFANMIATPISKRIYIDGNFNYIQEWCINEYKWLYYSGIKRGSFSQILENNGKHIPKTEAIKCKHIVYKKRIK